MTVSELVLSLFPGVGLLDMAFEETGFIVVQSRDKITGGDIRDFHGIKDRFNGIICGPPCQGFSLNNMKRKTGCPSVQNSREMLRQTCRVILECEPEWFLIENVPCVPDVRIEGYSVQRISLSEFECGGDQLRNRHIQFGSRLGHIIRPQRVRDEPSTGRKGRRVKAVTTKTDKWTSFPKYCRRQGLTKKLELPGWYRTAKVKAVGNGVPLRMGKTLASAVVLRAPREPGADCQCDCGRSVSARALTATASCRKRKQKSSETRPWVDIEGYHYV